MNAIEFIDSILSSIRTSVFAASEESNYSEGQENPGRGLRHRGDSGAGRWATWYGPYRERATWAEGDGVLHQGGGDQFGSGRAADGCVAGAGDAVDAFDALGDQ